MSKINVDWSKFPDWVKAVAMDQDQEWCAFSCPPIKGIATWYLPDEAHQICIGVNDLTEEIQQAIHVDSNSEPLEWKNTLILRPTEAPVPQKPETKKHPKDALIRAWLDGEVIEREEDGKWVTYADISSDTDDIDLPAFSNLYSYRIKPEPVRELNIKVFPNRDAGMAIHYQGKRQEKDEFWAVTVETPEFKDEVEFYAVYVEDSSGYDLWIGDFETETQACHFAQLAFNNLEPETDPED